MLVSEYCVVGYAPSCIVKKYCSKFAEGYISGTIVYIYWSICFNFF